MSALAPWNRPDEPMDPLALGKLKTSVQVYLPFYSADLIWWVLKRADENFALVESLPIYANGQLSRGQPMTSTFLILVMMVMMVTNEC